MNHWTIYLFINKTLRIWNRGDYLEVGAGTGLNVRKIEASRKHSVSVHTIPKPWAGTQYRTDYEGFMAQTDNSYKDKFGVVFLRDWNSENLEQRVKDLLPMVAPDGMLIIDGYDTTGKRNEAWRVAVGLKKRGVPCGTLKDKYLVVYKQDSAPITGKIASRMKRESYIKQADKLVDRV